MSEESQPEVKFTGNIRRLRLKPGDALVVEFPEATSQEQMAALAGQLVQKFPNNEIVALAGGVRITAVLSAPKVALPNLGTNGFATHR